MHVFGRWGHGFLSPVPCSFVMGHGLLFGGWGSSACRAHLPDLLMFAAPSHFWDDMRECRGCKSEIIPALTINHWWVAASFGEKKRTKSGCWLPATAHPRRLGIPMVTLFMFATQTNKTTI